MNVRYWKTLERHPLGAEYPDHDADTRGEMVRDLQQFGVVGNRPITLHEDKVIDGWQLYQACLEAGVKPTFKELKLPKGMSPERWVEIANDRRRHEDQSTISTRAAERRERVAAAREGGDSIRSIAEKEKVSPATVQQDLRCIPHTPEKVKGKDGKSYAPKTAPKQCPSCSRDARVGKAKKENCAECKALQPNAGLKTIQAVEEALGKIINAVEDCAAHFGKGKAYGKLDGMLNTFAKEWRNVMPKLKKLAG